MSPAVVAVGGGHGLAVTLRACQPWAGELTAVVSVADDGGSSGQVRAWTGLPAPGDVRRCLTTLAEPARATLAAALERRFDGGDLAGHPTGNLLLAALTLETGDLATAIAEVARVLGVRATVLPATVGAVDLVATRGDGSVVRGQVAAEEAGRVDAVFLDPPERAAAPEAVLKAVAGADLVVLGPGSLYGSVLAAAVAEGLPAALAAARTVYVCNLRAPAPETGGYDVAAHVAALRRHGIEPDVVVAQRGGLAIGDVGGHAEVVEADVAAPSGHGHDPAALGAALRAVAAR